MHAQYQTIIERFHSDETFRQAVLKDLNGAVKQEFGIDLPGRMRVVSETAGYRVEPIAGAGGELSDEMLDLVAGGNGKGGSPTPSPTYRGGSIISNNGANVIGQNGANIISNNGANFRR